MAIVAMVILGTLIFLLTGGGSTFRGQTTLYTYLNDSAALAQGSPVRLNGILIGNVKQVELSGDSTPGRVVRVTTEVYEDMLSKIPVDSQIAISAENLLGSKFLNIKMGSAMDTIQPNGEIAAEEAKEFDEIVESAYGLVATLNTILERVDLVVQKIESGEGTIGKFIADDAFYDSLAGTMQEFEKITKSVGEGQGTVGRLLYDETMYDRIDKTIADLDRVILDVQEGKGTLGKLIEDPALYEETKASIQEIRTLLAGLNEGRGPAGRLLKDEKLANDITSTMAAINLMLENINEGKGTLGQLAVNPTLYQSLDGFSTELREFMVMFKGRLPGWDAVVVPIAEANYIFDRPF
jgi:phospholipid/cholesterol/gamma-HCH transport system substrate-binding protein